MTVKPILFGPRLVGPGHPCLVIAEICINHNGSFGLACEMIDAAKAAGADAVKFQAGDPERYVNRDAWDTPRDTPHGTMRYIEYRKTMELSAGEFAMIDAHCKDIGIPWFVSPLNAEAVDRFERFRLPAYKVASPKLTDVALLVRLAAARRTVLLSTGMSNEEDVNRALAIVTNHGFNTVDVALFHCVSQYPCPDTDINLPALRTMQHRYAGLPIGYSGHESGIWPTLGAVSLGACLVERHFTTDRTLWGSDQAASLEPSGFSMMVRGIRSIEHALSGDGEKRLRDGEMANYRKFRLPSHAETAAD